MYLRKTAWLVAGVAFACLMGSVYGKGRYVALFGASKEEFMPNSQVPKTPWVTVEWGLTLDANTMALYQQMAEVLSDFTAVPQDRANYFSPYINNIGGWGGMVTRVVRDGGDGYVVTVSITGFMDHDQLDNDETGDLPTALLGIYSEIYHVDSAGNVTYGGPSIPPGMPTQLPFAGS